ncbi:MAG: hypothetical protein JNL18_00475 [Planctomycetaceae bacterium]|nr:hypothetical protein [Planctomycetaceae bacterium]
MTELAGRPSRRPDSSLFFSGGALMTFNRLTGTALLSALALWMLPCAADQASSLTLSTDEQHEDDSEGHFLISDDSKQHDDHEGDLLANDDEKHDDHGRFLASDDDDHEKDGDHGNLLADDDQDDERHDKDLA